MAEASGSAAAQAEAARRQWLPLLAIVVVLLLVQASYGLCTQDDAYISFRYARNLVEGHGLVFNPGERVEGYTNFLWTVLFAPFIGLGLDPAPVSISIGMITTAALLWATWEAAGRRWLAPALVATFAGLSLEGVQGLETAFFACCGVMAVRGGPRWSVWAGVAALTRPEGYAIFGILWILRRKPRDLLIFLAMTLPHLAFRVAYYGDIVPNTFHAKVGDPSRLAGSAAERGLRYLGSVAVSALPLCLAWLAAVGLALRKPADLLRDPIQRDGLALTGFFLLYVVAVGGDFKGTGRFFIPMLPLMAAFVALRLDALPRVGRLLLAGIALAASVPQFQAMSHFADRFAGELEQRRTAGELLKKATPAGTWIAVHAAGVLPYYAERPTLDMWGLNDAHIARAKVEGFGSGTAGHERHDYAYVLSRAPDLILPEAGLITAQPAQLANPPEFGAGFGEAYESVTLPMEGERFLNLWRRRDGRVGGG